MKTKLSLLALLLVVAQASFAQLRLGIKGGANFTKIDGKSFRDEFQYGYHLGGFAEIGLGKKFAIQPEVLFNQFQNRVDSSFRSVYQNSTSFSSNYQDVKLNYLSIPIMLNYKVGKLLTLQGGPQFGILIDQDDNLLQNGEEAFRSGDFSLAGGATINLAALRLTGRYFVGLNNVSEISDQNKWKNQGFQLSLGFAF